MTSEEKTNILQNDFPPEILGKMKEFHESLEKVKRVLEPLVQININSPDVNLTPLDRARLNLTAGYAFNSLFWMYLTTEGLNPQDHDIRLELDRYKEYMIKIKEIDDKKLAPRLDKGAAGRFVKGALWHPKEKNGRTDEENTTDVSKRPSESADNVKSKRRKS